jgi:hypothetical protein
VANFHNLVIFGGERMDKSRKIKKKNANNNNLPKIEIKKLNKNATPNE